MERCTFEITSYDYENPKYDDWKLPYNYHYLYILENGKDVYIGETNDIVKRTRKHHEKKDYCYQFHFKNIHIITGKHMEGTPAEHFERLLIKLMRVDNKFKVRNQDNGVRTFYQRKNEFELGFDRLWSQLTKIGLVKHKSFQLVLNRTEYKYSPYSTLTKEQEQTLNDIVNAIHTSDCQRNRDDSLRPILIEGDAGTGKTVLASSLFYYLKTNVEFKEKRVALVYSNTATRKALKNTFKCVPGNFGKNIISPIDITKEKYDIVICDEAHRLRRNKNLGMYIKHFKDANIRLGYDDTHNELDWLMKKSECLVLFYDKKQIASPSDIPYNDFSGALNIKECGTRPVELKEQMRIRAGEEYVPYIHSVLNQEQVSSLNFENYDFKLFSSFPDMMKALKEKEDSMGLSRLCSGYAWKWIAKNKPEIPDISIEGIDVWWNKQTAGWLDNPDAKNEMGSIYSLPGLDLNYAAVVIGPDLYFDNNTNKIEVNKKHFFDNKIKRNSSNEEIKQFILNTYSVLLTRGIYGTYVYVCDNALRTYLENFIPKV